MNCCLCSRERKTHGPWTSTRGQTNPIPCLGDELFPQDKWKHWWAQQWWNLSLDPECPAVMAPRPCDYVFSVYLFSQQSGLIKWVLILPSWAGIGGSIPSALRTEVWVLFRAPPQDCVKTSGAESCTPTAPFGIWQLRYHVQPNQILPSVSLSPGSARPLEGFRVC